MIEFCQRYFDADGWMSADKLAPIVAEVIVGFSCAVPFFVSEPIPLLVEGSTLLHGRVRGDKIGGE